MELFLKLLADGTILAWLAGVGAFIGAVVGITLKVYKTLEAYRQLRNTDEERKEKIEKNASAVAIVQKTIFELQETLNGVIDKMDVLNHRFDEWDEKTNNERRVARKVQIKDIYSKCNATKKIDSKELECLLELIESYEKAGGTNSFVHEIVIPQIKEWEVTDEEGDNDESSS